MKNIIALSGLFLLSVPLIGDNKPATKDLATNFDVSQLMYEGKKVDFVALSELMGNSTPGKQLVKELDDKRSVAEKEIRERGSKIAKAEKDLNDKVATMAKTAQSTEMSKIQGQKDELELFAKRKEQEIKEHYLAKSEELFNTAVQAINEVALKDKIDAVIDIESGRPLYLAKDMNKTPKYLAQLEQTHNQKLASSKNATDATKLAAKTGIPSLAPTKKA